MPKEREDKQFKSSSGICNIHAVIWYPDSDVYKKPVGVIQIAHGMIDHIERFEEMAEYFTGKGFVVSLYVIGYSVPFTSTDTVISFKVPSTNAASSR